MHTRGRPWEWREQPALAAAEVVPLVTRELRDREDWAFELSLLLRNRFLAHEFYDEYYGHLMSRRAWNQRVVETLVVNQIGRGRGGTVPRHVLG